MSDTSKLEAKLRKFKKFLEKDVPRIVGVEVKKHFEESFRKGGFTDRGLKKWAKPKRTDSNSSWYGFEYGSKAKRPGRKSKKGSVTNYSNAATKRKTLIGDVPELMNSITYQISRNKVVLISDRPYSKIHNEGGKIKVFGKATARMPQRQFMGESQAMRIKISETIRRKGRNAIN